MLRSKKMVESLPIMTIREESELTFSNHLDQSHGVIQGFCIYPEGEENHIYF